MFLLRLAPLALAGAALALAATSASAQITPVAGTGCPGALPPLVGPPPPKPGAVLTVSCPTVPVCLPGAPSVILFGSCLTPPVTFLPPTACLGPCTLDCLPFVAIPGPGPITVGPLTPGIVGVTFCVQCACAGADPTGLVCLHLSEKVTITTVPPGC